MMKKLIFGAMVAAVGIFGAYTMSQAGDEAAMSDLQLENLEALAKGESAYACPGAILYYDGYGSGSLPRFGEFQVGTYCVDCQTMYYLKIKKRCK